MAEHNRYDTHNHNLKDFKYDLTSQQRTSLNQTNDHLDIRYVQIRVTRHSSKLELHAIPKQDRNTVHRRTRTSNHNKPFGNQIDLVGGHSHC